MVEEDNSSILLKEYRRALDELDSKEVRIKLLALLADESASIAKDIVRLIEKQIFDSEPYRKLWLLYVMDSICKDPEYVHREVYRNLFAINVVDTFCHAFEHATKNIKNPKDNEEFRIKLHKLRVTWNGTFAEDKLHQIDVRIKQMDQNWPIASKKMSSSLSTSSSSSSSSSSPSMSPSIGGNETNPKLLPSTKHTDRSIVGLKKASPSSDLVASELNSKASTSKQSSVHVNPKFVTDRNRLMSSSKENSIRAQLLQKQQELIHIEEEKRDLEQKQRAQLSLTKKSPQEYFDHEQELPGVAFKKRLRLDRNTSSSEPSIKRRSPNSQWPAKRTSNGSPTIEMSATTTNIKPITTLIGSTTSDSPVIATNGSIITNVHINPQQLPPPLLAAPTLTTINNSSSSLPTLLNLPSPVTASIVNGHNGPLLPSSHLPSHPHPSINHLPPRIVSSAPVSAAVQPLGSHITRFPPPPIDHSLRPPPTAALPDSYRPDMDYRTQLQNWRQNIDYQLNSGALSGQEHVKLINEIDQAVQLQNGRPFYGSAGTRSMPPSVLTSSSLQMQSPEELTVAVDKETRKLFYLDYQTAIVLMKPHVSEQFEMLRLQNPIDLDVRLIKFEGQPTNVWIDDSICILLGFDGLWKTFKYNDCEQNIKFGGPGKEVFLNNQTIQAQFGGSPVSCYLNGDRLQHMIRLDGPPPRVKLSEQPRPDLWRRLVELYSGSQPSHHLLTPHHPALTLPLPTPVGSSPMINSMLPSLINQKSSVVRHSTINKTGAAPVNVNDLFSKLVAANLLPAKPEAGKSGASEGATALQTLRNKSTTGEVQSPVGSPNIAEDSKSNKYVPRRFGNHEIDLKQIHPPLQLQSDSLKQRRPQLIELLYRGTQCTNCSLRFDVSFKHDDQNSERYLRAKSKYAQHLDWHFRQNRKLRSKPTSSSANLKRPWYYSIDLWKQFREITEEEDEAAALAGQSNSFGNLSSGKNDLMEANKPLPLIRAFSDESLNMCSICYERFEQIWCEDEEEWKLENAVQSEDGSKCFHPLCLNDLTTTSIEMTEDRDEEEDENDQLNDIEMAEPLMNESSDDFKIDDKQVEESKSFGNLDIITHNNTTSMTDETQQSNGQETKEDSVEINSDPIDSLMDENETFELNTNNKEDEEEVKEKPEEITMETLEESSTSVPQPILPTLEVADVVEPTVALENALPESTENKSISPPPSDRIKVEIIGLDLPFVTSQDGFTTTISSSADQPTTTTTSTTMNATTVGEGSNELSTFTLENGGSTDKIECHGSHKQNKPILLKLNIKESNLDIVNRNKSKSVLEAGNDSETTTTTTTSTILAVNESSNHIQTAKSESQEENRTEVIFRGREESALCNIM